MPDDAVRNVFETYDPGPSPVAQTATAAPEVERPVPDRDPILRYSVLGLFLIAAAVALSLAKTIAMPITAGIIFGLVLGPLVDAMVRRGVPQHLAAFLVVCAGGSLIFGAFTLLAVPVAAWSDQVPAMVEAMRTRLGPVFDALHQAEAFWANLSPGAKPTLNVSEGTPLIDLALSSSTAAGGLLLFVATVYFYLATRRHIKARALRLCLGRSARQSAGVFFETIEMRVAHYFGVVTLINVGVGIAAFAIAWLAGLPFPVFWAALAFVLNYVAFIGPIIVVGALLAAGLVASPTIAAALAPALAFGAVHLVEANALTPMIVGSSLTLSPFLVLLSFVFWLWLWGPVGAVLSTPLLLVATIGTSAVAAYRRQQAEEGA